MVRLEKIIYEQLVNTRTFKRERILASPKKWYNNSRQAIMRVAAVKGFSSGVLAAVFRVIEPAFSYFTYQWQKDYLLQRGLAMEDIVVFQDRELRRDPFFEHIMREGFHPYTYLMFEKRRARYYKVERAVRGTYAPDWLRAEAEQRTLAESVKVRREWKSYYHNNYISDMTPTTRPSVLQKVIFLEYVYLYGLLRLDAWDRFFYNEVFYKGHSYTPQQLAKPPSPFARFNLSTEDGRRRFEIEISRFQSIYPGALVRPGEKFDFTTYYALDAIKNKRDLSSQDPALIKQLKTDIRARALIPSEEKAKGRKQKSHQTVPEWLGAQPGTGIFTQ